MSKEVKGQNKIEEQRNLIKSSNEGLIKSLESFSNFTRTQIEQNNTIIELLKHIDNRLNNLEKMS